ncbi:MAG TPA: hypothetical protein VFA27_10310 [Vicinamibacterales bacterium]|nr:hypothetical protein [Vicinamibacterales bacterium]
MPWLPILAWALASQTADVSAIALTPATVIELDLGQLKGELRQIGWSPDASQLYIQTVDGDPPKGKVRHYIVASEGGPLTPADRQPEWARAYWAFKSDRTAPGVPALEIEVKQSHDTTKIGAGSSRPGTMAGSLADNAENASMASEGQRDTLWRFVLLDQTIAEFKDTRPIPGLTFSWGPTGSGAIAFTDRDGRLAFLDQAKHKRTIAGVKDATLPAWSSDGSRIAYAVKQGRKKYQLVWCTITR